MNRKILLVVLISLFLLTVANSQESETSLYITPVGLVAIGSSSDNFNFGGGANVGFDFKFPFSSLFFLRSGLGYNYLPINELSDVLSIFSLEAGTGVDFPVFPFMDLNIYGTGGYYLGIIDTDNVGGDFFFTGGLEADFKISSTFSLGFGASYKNFLSTPSSSPVDILFHGIGAQLSGKFILGAPRKPSFEFKGIRTEPIFPIFYTYYDDNNFGEALIINDSENTVKDLKISIFIPQYMDESRVITEISEIKGGEEKPISLYALFNESILEVTEGSKVSMELILDYTFAGKQIRYKQVETIEVLHRNAMVWDDDRKAASFVTSKDPDVLRFSKNISSAIRKNPNTAVNNNFRIALGLFEALNEYGMGYVIDPNSSYIELSSNSLAIDYLQFPSQSLTYKAGDCDDLSILYSALLESVGIETAFITIPGHIYMAFSLGLSQKEANKLFITNDNLIFIDDETWIPVEITLVQEGFVKAWRVGAKQWRDHNAENNTAFFPIHEAWKIYSPVSSPNETTDIAVPEIESFNKRYQLELNRFVSSEIQGKVDDLKSKIIGGTNPERYRSSLGVLYARYGLLEEAVHELKISSDNSFPPAMINLANVYFIQGKYEEALVYYRMAARRLPDRISVLVGLARTNYQLENHAEVNKVFVEIEKKDPDMADRYAYLIAGGDVSVRASSAVDKEILTWEE